MTGTKSIVLYRPREKDEAPLVWYFLAATDLADPGSAVATLVCIADGPIPDPAYIIVKTGGADLALRKAEKVVRRLAGNEGLKKM